MEENQNQLQNQFQEQNQQRKKQTKLMIIGFLVLVIGLVGVTYAFFNYTRTGSANTIRTGRIAFNSQQGQAINLTNMFPIDVTNGIPNDATKVGSVTINVTGDTTYSDGIEYLVSAVNVQNTIGSGANAKQLPISIDVSVASNTGNDPATTLGTEDEDYFTNRGASANTSIYKVLASDVIANNDQLVVGYIKSGATGVDGNIVIRAYLDASKILISDTYNNGNAPTDNLGTPVEMGEGKTAFTTNEWNSLQANGISFQVKVESNEGTWIETPVVVPTIASCPGCKFMYTTNTTNYYQYGGANNANATEVANITEIVSDNYNDVITNDRKYFLGFTETQDGKIDKAYVCGIKGEDPNNGTAFCIEGYIDGSTFIDKMNFLNAFYGETYDSERNYGCYVGGSSIYCYGSIQTSAYTSGGVDVVAGGNGCGVYQTGVLYCYE